MIHSVALGYCHSLGVAHRDIKPENLMYSDYSKAATIKLTDFGLSAIVPQEAVKAPASRTSRKKSAALLHDAVGSTYYVAPEVLKEVGYGVECDVWSLGVVLYVTLGGYPPFDGPNELKVFDAIINQPLRFADPTWQSISRDAKEFITAMLTKDPRRRSTIPELLGHPWLAAAAPPPPRPAARAAPSSAAPAGIRGVLRGRAGVNVPVPDAVVTRLQRFAAMNRFKKEARRVLAAFLPEEEVVGLLALFTEMDANNDGVLTLAELQHAILSKGIRLPDKVARRLLECADLNGDGVIDYGEFLGATVHQIRLDKDELTFKAFKHFDRDESGFISKEELREALGAHPDADVDGILHDVDTDNDGRINYEEFCNCLRMRESEAGLGGRFGGGGGGGQQQHHHGTEHGTHRRRAELGNDAEQQQQSSCVPRALKNSLSAGARCSVGGAGLARSGSSKRPVVPAAPPAAPASALHHKLLGESRRGSLGSSASMRQNRVTFREPGEVAAAAGPGGPGDAPASPVERASPARAGGGGAGSPRSRARTLELCASSSRLIASSRALLNGAASPGSTPTRARRSGARARRPSGHASGRVCMSDSNTLPPGDSYVEVSAASAAALQAARDIGFLEGLVTRGGDGGEARGGLLRDASPRMTASGTTGADTRAARGAHAQPASSTGGGGAGAPSSPATLPHCLSNASRRARSRSASRGRVSRSASRGRAASPRPSTSLTSSRAASFSHSAAATSPGKGDNARGEFFPASSRGASYAGMATGSSSLLQRCSSRGHSLNGGDGGRRRGATASECAVHGGVEDAAEDGAAGSGSHAMPRGLLGRRLAEVLMQGTMSLQPHINAAVIIASTLLQKEPLELGRAHALLLDGCRIRHFRDEQQGQHQQHQRLNVEGVPHAPVTVMASAGLRAVFDTALTTPHHNDANSDRSSPRSSERLSISSSDGSSTSRMSLSIASHVARMAPGRNQGDIASKPGAPTRVPAPQVPVSEHAPEHAAAPQVPWLNLSMIWRNVGTQAANNAPSSRPGSAASYLYSDSSASSPASSASSASSFPSSVTMLTPAAGKSCYLYQEVDAKVERDNLRMIDGLPVTDAIKDRLRRDYHMKVEAWQNYEILNSKAVRALDEVSSHGQQQLWNAREEIAVLTAELNYRRWQVAQHTDAQAMVHWLQERVTAVVHEAATSKAGMISEANAVVSKLAEQYAELARQLGGSRSEADALRSQLWVVHSGAAMRPTEQSQDLAEARSEVDALWSQLAGSRPAAAVKAERSLAAGVILQLRSKLDAAEVEALELDAQTRWRTIQLAAANVERLDAMSEQVASTRSDAAVHAHQLAAELRELQAQLSASLSKAASSHEVATASEEALAELQAQLSASRSEVASSQEAAAASSEVVAASEEALTEVWEQLSASHSEAAASREALAARKAALASQLPASRAEVAFSHEPAAARKATLASQLAASRPAMDAVCAQLAIVQTQASEVAAAHAAQMSVLSGQLAAARSCSTSGSSSLSEGLPTLGYERSSARSYFAPPLSKSCTNGGVDVIAKPLSPPAATKPAAKSLWQRTVHKLTPDCFQHPTVL
ncbi:hypothetical protein FOA52_014830 [Chlamydomonas sp. UWO 241]|nr:hypothetical protein FOA52_014830 [Chlamydomonas sp. UWO 241]